MNVLVLSDNKIYGDALDSVVRCGFPTVTVRVAESVGAAFTAMESKLADVLLFDVRVEGVLSSTSAFRFRWSTTYLVAFGVDTAGQEALCQRTRVDRIFYKEAAADELLHALEGWSREKGASRLAAASQVAAVPIQEVALSTREREVAQLIERGLSNKEIARRLGIGVATVKNHVHNLLQKLQAEFRLEAMVRLRSALEPKPQGASSYKP